MRSVAVVGGGAGGAAAVAELVARGHAVNFWARSPATLAPFQEQGGVGYEGVLGTGLARPKLITSDLAAAVDAADVVLVCLPTFAHGDIARGLASAGTKAPVVLNPGHTGGALEFRHNFRALGVDTASDRRVLDADLRCAQAYARPRYDHRKRQERAACGLAGRYGGA